MTAVIWWKNVKVRVTFSVDVLCIKIVSRVKLQFTLTEIKLFILHGCITDTDVISLIKSILVTFSMARYKWYH